MGASKKDSSNSAWSQKLAKRVDPGALGFPLLAYDEINSTSDLLKSMAEAGAPEGTCVVAGTQKQGRGQHGRSWYSEPGLGTYFSVLFRPRWARDDLKWLSPMTALAVTHTLQDMGLKKLTLKWPNDVLANDKKIAGVLVEPRLGNSSSHFAIAGMGINVCHRDDQWPGDLRFPATSCSLEGVEATCDDVLLGVLKSLDQLYQRVCGEGPEFLDKLWKELSADEPFGEKGTIPSPGSKS